MRNAIRLATFLLLALLSASCRSRGAEGLLPDPDVALMEAVRDGSLEEIRKLIALGATPNPRLREGRDGLQSPLAVAVLNGNFEAVQILLEAGADPNAREYRERLVGRTPLIIASGLGRGDIVTLLLQRGAQVNLRGGEFQVEGRISSNSDALFHATAAGHAEVVRVLLLWGADVDRADLKSAISQGRDDLAWLLLAADADPRWIMSTGRSALEEAERLPAKTRHSMVATIKSFLAHDPPIGNIDQASATPRIR